MGISRRHHYIPQFLIKKFADSDNMLYLYDKEKKTFAKEKRSPKSIFFEMNRNILDFGGTANDNLEKLYAELDEKFSRDLTEIIATKNITEEGLTSLLVMVSSLKWRLPVNDELFYDKDRQYTYDKLPISIKAINDDGSQNTEAIEHLLNSEIFNRTKRLIFPFLPFYNNYEIAEDKLSKLHQNSYIDSNEIITSILGDSPIIESKRSDIEDFGNFILPLGNKETFICSDSGNKKVNSIAFYVNKDLAMFHQAKKYVVCCNKDHLAAIIYAYQNLHSVGQTNLIHEHIFKFV
ncbi:MULTISPECIES: DUF4238 domain-containing protein [Bacteroidota]|jgi:hypothetical protein|uniref:DUF4238 domain-containing protein n=6 Tax=Bacteroidota TaxID=976 RepID=A0A1X7HWG0_9SPHI|nr:MULTISPECIES: DUF4238 domain-containing protein [Bacteroidota]ALU27703.1 hypothetical protein AS202_16795 [Myroides odoratimimus]EHM7981531.1 DUF4238 domain-containing protein [Elizabethkingia anophelis]EHM8033134.1 DUF4238 domain-containing protein [Elizabethkingia anophelis]EHZ9535742.1 DUF4238 domain-containing protein [Elizabethkingia anophelis]EKU3673650.1 DUF4238 domain-containing protein [Elizabethkingia anophelis]